MKALAVVDVWGRLEERHAGVYLVGTPLGGNQMSIDISPLAIIASVVGDVIVATSIIGLVRRRRARRVDIPSRDYNPLYPRHGFTVLDPADVGEPRSTFAARVLNDTASRGSFFAKRADEV